MLSKQQFLDSVRHETGIVKHLARTLRSEALGYRPSPGQRSTLELLRYLSYCGVGTAQMALTQAHEHFAELQEEAEAVTLETFAVAMDRQRQRLEDLLAPLDEDELASAPSRMPWGAPCRLGEALVNLTLKTLVAYRMQLFLYAKACGAQIGTSDCWAGVAAPAVPARP